MTRYRLEACYGGWQVLDNMVEDGKDSFVDGSTDKAKAQAMCDRLNYSHSLGLQADLHDKGLPCELEDCQDCCPHDERDHGICLDCGHEEDPGRAIDRAMDYWEGER